MKRTLEDTKNTHTPGGSNNRCLLRLSIAQVSGAVFRRECFSKSMSSSLPLKAGVTYRLGRAPDSWYQTADRRISRCHAAVVCIQHPLTNSPTVLLTARGLNSILAVIKGADVEVRTGETVPLEPGDGFRLAATIHPLVQVLPPQDSEGTAEEEAIIPWEEGCIDIADDDDNVTPGLGPVKRHRTGPVKPLIEEHFIDPVAMSQHSPMSGTVSPKPEPERDWDQGSSLPPRVLYLNSENLKVLDGKVPADPGLLRLREPDMDDSRSASQKSPSGPSGSAFEDFEEWHGLDAVQG